MERPRRTGSSALSQIRAVMALANFFFPVFFVGILVIYVLVGSFAHTIGIRYRDLHFISVPYDLPFIDLELLVNATLGMAFISYVLFPLLHLVFLRANSESFGAQQATIPVRDEAERVAERLQAAINRLGYARRRIRLPGEPRKLVLATPPRSRPWLPRLYVVVGQAEEILQLTYVEIPNYIWRFSRSERLKEPIAVAKDHAWWTLIRRSVEENQLTTGS
jgi:hypothetical protein